ncbi:hypothetical protein Tco_1143748 [Tanacetum coccineum]
MEMLWRLPFYCTPPAAAHAVIPDPTLEDLVVGTPSAKILAKAKAFQKRKASTSGSTSSHFSKRTSRDDDDAYVQIPLVTPILSAAVIPSSRNQGGSSAPPTAEGLSTQDSQGKGIMVDDVAAPSVGASRPRPSSGGVVGNCEFTHEEWDAPYRPTFGVLTRKSLRLLLFAEGYEERVASLTQLELQVSALKRQVSGLNDKLSSFDASFAKSNDKGNERKKKIKSLTKSLDNLQAEVARLSADINRATILEAEKYEEILRLKATDDIK